MKESDPDVGATQAPMTRGGCLKGLASLFAVGAVLLALGLTFDLEDQSHVALIVAGALAMLASLLWILPSARLFDEAQGSETIETEEELSSRYPEEPWRWQAAWNENRILWSTSGSAWTTWVLFTVWLVVTTPFASLGVVRYSGSLKEIFGFVALGLLDLLFLAVAVSQTLAMRRFGRSWVSLDSVPARIGGKAAGWCDIEKGSRLEGEATVALACLVTVAGREAERGGSAHSRVHWTAEQRVSASDVRRVDLMSRIPFDIPVRAGLPSSGMSADGSEGTNWKLTVRAPLESGEFVGEFLIPVFDLESAAGTTDGSPREARSRDDAS